MRRPHRLFAALTLLGAALIPAARGQDLLPMPEPDLSAMDDAVRQRIESIQAAVADLSTAETDPARLSQAIGELGQHYLANELMDASAVAFRNAAILRPEDFRWPYLLGVVQQSRGELEDAAGTFPRVLELRPDDLATVVRLGDVLLELGRLDEAEARYRRVLEIDPDSAAGHSGLGKVAASRGDHAQAVERFEKTLELQSDATIVHYPLGQSYRKLGNLDKAREHLRQRGQERVRFPDLVGSRVAWLSIDMAMAVVQGLANEEGDFSEVDYLGFVLSQLGEVDGAVDQLEEALRIQATDAASLDPASEEAARQRLIQARLHYVVGGLLVNQRDDEAARSHFETALELAPELLDPRIKLGNIAARAERFDEAIAAYSEALNRNPASSAALLKRAAARMSQGQEPQAIADLEQLLANEPGHVEARLRLARALEQSADAEGARRQYLAALELDLSISERALTQYHLGELGRKTGDLDEAIRRYEEAVDLDPELVDARFQLATALGRQRRFEDAARRYRELIELEPQHLRGRLGEATALNLVGRHADARDKLESGLMAMPGSLELTHTLARLLASCEDRAQRDGERAVELAQEAVAAQATLVHGETLAMAFAEAGSFEEARQLQTGLLAQAEARGDQRSLPRLRHHLALYERGEACCSQP
ncbi:MAG: tetratricopeptide repeat protein [bacterium]|nr:tetratricopeptide repeat protein [bacterium]